MQCLKKYRHFQLYLKQVLSSVTVGRHTMCYIEVGLDDRNNHCFMAIMQVNLH